LINNIIIYLHHKFITHNYYSHILYFRAKEFRTAFSELHTLCTFFPKVPHAALSGTLTSTQLKTLPKTLGLVDAKVVRENPDRPNIFMSITNKPAGQDPFTAYEGIYMTECDKLVMDPDSYPVTLMYLPLKWCSAAHTYCHHRFEEHTGSPVTLENCRFGCLFSRQDAAVSNTITADLKTETPRIRLVFCTSSVGMGFDAPSITHIIHDSPPRNLSDYFQEIGVLAVGVNRRVPPCTSMQVT
jgi:superfamily II DNA helicase RecQ